MARKISVFGDSISTFEKFIPEGNCCYYFEDDPNETSITSVDQTWWMQCIENLDAEFLANGSYSGSTVEGVAFPAADSQKRALQVLGVNGEEPDDILVFIGINDYGWGHAAPQVMSLPVNEYEKPDPATLPRDMAGSASEENLIEFKESYTSMLSCLKEVAPNAQIHAIALIPGRVQGQQRPTFCHMLRGIDIERYNDAIKQACDAAGCSFEDIYSYGYDYSSCDGTHPNILGMKQIANLVESSINHTEPDQNLFEISYKSGRNCNEASCLDCEYARSTGNQWSCVCEKFMK